GEHTIELKAVTSGYIIELDNKRLVEIARMLGAPNDKGSGIEIHKKKGELVKVDETILTLYAEKDWKLTQAIESAQRETPIVVEGMLLERMPKFKEV
ncbi:MAG: thymidine phosphorylase, partial [Methanosarcinales archaeon]|nr:thymidine phosphorylase [Methanosarcinales archaeon]